jgi:hypothetical protein
VIRVTVRSIAGIHHFECVVRARALSGMLRDTFPIAPTAQDAVFFCSGNRESCSPGGQKSSI